MDQKLALKLSWLIGLILALLPFHAFLITWVGSNTGHLDLWRIWKEILIALISLPSIWLAWRRPDLRHWFFGSTLARLIWLYILLQLVMAGWSMGHHATNSTAIIYGLIINLRFLAIFFICITLVAYNDWLKKVWHYLLLTPAGLVILFGLVQKLFLPYDFLRHFGYSPRTIPAYQTVDATLNFRRIQSTLRGSNPLGAYLVLILTALVSQPFMKRFVKALYFAAGVAVLYFTYSRSAWVGLAISLGLIMWWSMSHRRRTSQLTIVIAAIGLIVAAIFYLVHYNKSAQDTLLHTSASSTSEISSNAERVQAMKLGVKDVIHQPLGRGVGTAGPASFRDKAIDPRLAENYYLQIGQEVGIIGIILFIAMNALLAKQLWRNRQDILAKILLASLAGITFINLLSHAWTDDTLSLIWWSLAGIAISSNLLNNKHKHNLRKVS